MHTKPVHSSFFLPGKRKSRKLSHYLFFRVWPAAVSIKPRGTGENKMLTCVAVRTGFIRYRTHACVSTSAIRDTMSPVVTVNVAAGVTCTRITSNIVCNINKQTNKQTNVLLELEKVSLNETEKKAITCHCVLKEKIREKD